MELPDDPDGLMVLAMWFEAAGQLRVRITRSTSARQEHPETSYASTKADVLRAVESWFEEFVTAP